MTAFVDTNVLVRHLTGDPPDQAVRATTFLGVADDLLLADLIVAELAYVLGSVYKASRMQIADSIRALLGHPPIRTVDRDLLLRTVEVYEHEGLDFPDAYLVASAERSGVGAIASFDRSIDRIATVRRLEPD